MSNVTTMTIKNIRTKSFRRMFKRCFVVSKFMWEYKVEKIQRYFNTLITVIYRPRITLVMWGFFISMCSSDG